MLNRSSVRIRQGQLYHRGSLWVPVPVNSETKKLQEKRYVWKVQRTSPYLADRALFVLWTMIDIFVHRFETRLTHYA